MVVVPPRRSLASTPADNNPACSRLVLAPWLEADRPEPLAPRPPDCLNASLASLGDDRAHRADNSDIPGAAAQIAAQPDTDGAFVGRIEA